MVKYKSTSFSKRESFPSSTSLTKIIHRNKRKNFASVQISGSSGMEMKVAQMEKSGLAALVDLELEAALERRVTEECLSIYNVDGSMRKTAKSKLLDLFCLKAVDKNITDYVSVVDMGLIWRLATPTPLDYEARKRDGSDYRWSDYIEKICSLTFSRHANTDLFILVNDKYDFPYSIKDDERDRRAAKHFHIPNVFPKSEDKFPLGSDFQKLMLNSGNKVRLQKLLKEMLITKAKGVQGTIIYCEGHMSTNLTTNVETLDYTFNHAEADTMMLSTYDNLRNTMEQQWSYNGATIEQ